MDKKIAIEFTVPDLRVLKWLLDSHVYNQPNFKKSVNRERIYQAISKACAESEMQELDKEKPIEFIAPPIGSFVPPEPEGECGDDDCTNPAEIQLCKGCYDRHLGLFK